MEIKFEPLYVSDNTTMDQNEKSKNVKWIGTFQIQNRKDHVSDRKIIGDVYPYGRGAYTSFPTKDEAEAYARLFAAAPELLDACIEVLECLANSNHRQHERELLSNAIKKASNG